MDIWRNHRNNMNTSSRDSFEFEVSVRVHGNVLATGWIILQHMYSLFFFLKNTIEPAKRLISPGQPFITARKYQKHMHGSERSVKVLTDIWSREIFITIQCRQEAQKSRHWSKNMPLPFPVLHLGLLPLILCTMMTNCLPIMASIQYSWFMIASVLNSLILVNFYVLIILFYVFILYYYVDIKNNF